MYVTRKSKRLAISVVLLLMPLPAIAGEFECDASKDEFKGTESISVLSEIALSSKPAQIIIGFEKDGDVIKYALVGLFVFDDWKFLGKEAYDSNKQKLDRISTTRRTAGGGSVVETVQFVISKSYLEEHALTGIKLRIYGKRGNADMSVDASMISEFFSCLSANQ